MRILLVTQRTRAGSDETSRRETVLDHDPVRIGRGGPMEITLTEIDVDYHHATVTAEGGQLKVSAVGENGLIQNGKRVHDAILTPGASVEVGRHRFTAEAGRDGADHVLIMEVLAAAPAKVKRERKALSDVLPSRRAVAWLFALIILGGLVLWPLSHSLTRQQAAEGEIVVANVSTDEVRAPHPVEALWSPGPMSEVHAGIGGDCGACHKKAFEQVTATACLTCHAETEHHAVIEGHDIDAFDNIRCAECHKEHNGGKRPVETATLLCTTCHANLAEIAPDTGARPVGSFVSAHPNFEPAIVTEVKRGPDGTLQSVIVPRPFPKDAVLQEISGLKFPHEKHLSKDGVVLTSGRQRLECADCHQIEADGDLMRPIKMERDCGGCHRMEFAPAGTAIGLPHADEAGIARAVREYFETRAAEGNVTLVTEQPRRRRRLGGKATAVPAQQLDANWVEEQTQAELDSIFGKRLCANCHEAQKVGDPEIASGWLVQPALLQRNWMPRANFSHKRHEEMACTSCHASEQSKSSTDVLMPQIATCRECHSREGQPDPLLDFFQQFTANEASAQETAAPAQPQGIPAREKKVASAECVTCHSFHREGEAPISPAHAEAFTAQFGKSAGAGE